MENFNKVYSENNKRVLNYVAKKVNDLSIAEEITNDVFMKVYKHLHRYDENIATMSTWIMNIANNTIIDFYRKKKMLTNSIDETIIGDSKKTLKEMLPTSGNPYTNMVTDETMSIVEDKINSLNGKYRDVAELYFLNQLSYQDISNRLNLPLGTVKGHLFRARQILCEELKSIRA